MLSGSETKQATSRHLVRWIQYSKNGRSLDMENCTRAPCGQRAIPPFSVFAHAAASIFFTREGGARLHTWEEALLLRGAASFFCTKNQGQPMYVKI